jgi:hypothetical protein
LARDDVRAFGRVERRTGSVELEQTEVASLRGNIITAITTSETTVRTRMNNL